LLEVVLAIALLGIVLAVSMELLSVGLRSARSAGDYTGAVLLANRKLAELSLAPPVAGAPGGAGEGGYTWHAEIEPRDTAEEMAARLYTLRVAVAWPGRGGEKRLELTTLRVALEEEQIIPAGATPPAGTRGAAAPRGRTPAPRTTGGAR
jgi:general secretion pathway protein I